MEKWLRPNLPKTFFLGIILLLIFSVFYWQKAKPLSDTSKTAVSCADCNIILISIDTLRADHLGVYGYDKKVSPNIDDFAKKAVVFKNAFSAAPWTLPSHAALFTGKYPNKLGIFLPTDFLKEEEVTLAEMLKNKGYKTAAISPTGAFVHKSFGFAQGFDEFVKTGAGMKDWHDARETFEKGANFVSQNKERKFFLFLHTFQVHDPYGDWDGSAGKIEIDDLLTFAKGEKSPEEIESFAAKVKEKYDEDIAYTDSQIQKIFEAVLQSGLEKKTIVAIVADHGEEFGERGLVGFHAYSFYNELLHVPLILKVPGISGRSIGENVSLADVVPTILQITGIYGGVFDGVSLAALINGGKRESPYIFAASSLKKELMLNTLKSGYEALNKMGPQDNWRKPGPVGEAPVGYSAMVRDGSLKLIENADGTAELYNLEQDPGEESNLALEKSEGPILDRLQGLLKEFKEKAAN